MIRRQAVVANQFYPGNPDELLGMTQSMLSNAADSDIIPRALIAPHAGYIYSGPVAASAYKLLTPLRSRIKTVLLLGPSHRVAFKGIAVSNADYFTSPLGDIALDKEKIDQLLSLPQVHSLEQAHTYEHSLEVHLPFLQLCLDDIKLIPLVVGDATTEEVADVIAQFWEDDSVFTIVSSDLSHYHPYATAQRMDRNTSDAIENLEAEEIGYDDACGRNPIKGLLSLAKAKQQQAITIDLRNSGDTGGDKNRVVGYGAYAIY